VSTRSPQKITRVKVQAAPKRLKKRRGRRTKARGPGRKVRTKTKRSLGTIGRGRRPTGNEEPKGERSVSKRRQAAREERAGPPGRTDCATRRRKDKKKSEGKTLHISSLHREGRGERRPPLPSGLGEPYARNGRKDKREITCRMVQLSGRKEKSLKAAKLSCRVRVQDDGEDSPRGRAGVVGEGRK